MPNVLLIEDDRLLGQGLRSAGTARLCCDTGWRFADSVAKQHAHQSPHQYHPGR
jgi:hypothetical protein